MVNKRLIIDEFTGKFTGNKRWKLRHPEKCRQSERERKKRYVEKDPLRNLLKQVKTRAKKKGWEFSITKEDLPEIPLICPVLGIKLERNSEKGWWPYSPSIDRIDNSKGYVKGNVRIISWRANSIKGDATVDEVEMVLKYMKKEAELCVD